MSRTEDFKYYCRRERQERDFAMRSLDPAVVAIHLQIAEHFVELKKEAGASLGISISSAAASREKIFVPST